MATKKKPVKAADVVVRNNYELVNNFDGVITEVMQIRDYGCIVRERDLKSGSISSIFIPGIKKKSKGDWKRLIKNKPLTDEQKKVRAEKRLAKKAKAKK